MGDRQGEFQHLVMDWFIADLCIEKEPCERTPHEPSTKQLQKLRNSLWWQSG